MGSSQANATIAQRGEGVYLAGAPGLGASSKRSFTFLYLEST